MYTVKKEYSVPDHPVLATPGVKLTTWDAYMGRWVSYPHGVLRKSYLDNYVLKKG